MLLAYQEIITTLLLIWSKVIVSQQKQKTLSTCPYCGVGCGVEITRSGDQTFSVAGDKNHPSNFGHLCTKGRSLADTLTDQTRLGAPTIKGAVTSWSKTTAYIASRLREAIDQYGPNSVAFYGSGQLLTEDYYVANKFIKGFIGSGNIDTNSRLCMSSAVDAHKRAFGRDCVPTCYSDLEQADLIVLTGSNLAWCHPVIHQRIRAEKKRRPTLKIVVIDPRKTATCELADLHLPINSGTDILLYNALLCYLDTHGHASTEHFEPNDVERTLAKARSEQTSDNTLTVLLGVEQAALKQFFQWFGDTEKVVSVFSMGVNQSAQGVDKGNAIINCHLLTNRIGRPGMGPNAMGGREVGGLATTLAAHLGYADPVAHELVSEFWQTGNLAQQPGLTAVDMFEAVNSGKIKAIWIMATNPLVSMPNTELVKQALKKCPLVIVSDAFSDSETIQYADVVLPACAWGEKSGTITNAERRISRQRAFKAPYQQSKPDWWMICEVAKAMGFAPAFDYQNEAQIFKEHAQLSALAAKHTGSFDISALAELDEQQYQRLRPVQWPQANVGTIELQDLRLFADGQFPTLNGRPNMVPIKHRWDNDVVPKAHYKQAHQLTLNSGRNRDQWHTMTRSSLSTQLNQHIPEPVMLLHPDDAKVRQIIDGSIINISNTLSDMLIRVSISKSVREGEVFAPIHWSNSNTSSGPVNQLIHANYDPLSKQPAFKSSSVTLIPAGLKSEALLLTQQKLATIDAPYWICQPVNQGFLYHIADKISPEQLLSDLTKQLKRQSTKKLKWLNGGTNNRLTRTAITDSSDNESEVTWSIQVSDSKHHLDASWQTDALSQPTSASLKCALLSGCAHGEADKGQLICLCKKVGLKQLNAAITQQQAGVTGGDAGLSVKEIGELTGAGTACGSCIGDIGMVLEG
jgi:assimilatory nitrate reductase catalytic subunit